jgi:DNA-binding IclR family transcriptional regulator
MVKVSSTTDVKAPDGASPREAAGSQTLLRGLEVLNVVANGVTNLGNLSERLGLTKSTTHRLASALVDQRYLTFTHREGYSLGPKLLELGYQASQQMDIPRLARPYLEALSASSLDTVHLGILRDGSALYLDKIAGTRRINIGSRVGERHPLATTGLGKALLLDDTEDTWRTYLEAELGPEGSKAAWATWAEIMKRYVPLGHAFDLEENEKGIRCVAAPVRDVSGAIVAAISCSSAAQYMDDSRMESLSVDVKKAARAISAELGWTDPSRVDAPSPNPAGGPSKSKAKASGKT